MARKPGETGFLAFLFFVGRKAKFRAVVEEGQLGSAEKQGRNFQKIKSFFFLLCRRRPFVTWFTVVSTGFIGGHTFFWCRFCVVFFFVDKVTVSKKRK